MDRRNRLNRQAHEEVIQAAIAAKNSGRYPSLRKAAIEYGLSPATVAYRAAGRGSHMDTTRSNSRLTEAEEEAIVNWITTLNEHGFPPAISSLCEIASTALRARGMEDSPVVGINWAHRFLTRHPDLHTRWVRQLDRVRADGVTAEGLIEWLRLFLATRIKHGIRDEDIFNMDETGLNMGQSVRQKAVINGKSKAFRKQPGTRTWVSILETIRSDGTALSPLVIFKGKHHMANWFSPTSSPTTASWQFATSPNGWTDDQLAMAWLERVFEPETRQEGRTRLLVIDGHGSHLTGAFQVFCIQHGIVALCLPPHTSHVTQPLDVAIFGPLKTYYGQELAARSQAGLKAVNPAQWISMYAKARAKAMSKTNIQAAFQSTGLLPYCEEKLLGTLPASLRRPLTPPDRPIRRQVPDTPHTLPQLRDAAQYAAEDPCDRPGCTTRSNKIYKSADKALVILELARKHMAEVQAETQANGRPALRGRPSIAASGRCLGGSAASADAAEQQAMAAAAGAEVAIAGENQAGMAAIDPELLQKGIAHALSVEVASHSWKDFCGTVEF